jgi:hypothetical protein
MTATRLRSSKTRKRKSGELSLGSGEWWPRRAAERKADGVKQASTRSRPGAISMHGFRIEQRQSASSAAGGEEREEDGDGAAAAAAQLFYAARRQGRAGMTPGESAMHLPLTFEQSRQAEGRMHNRPGCSIAGKA